MSYLIILIIIPILVLIWKPTVFLFRQIFQVPRYFRILVTQGIPQLLQSTWTWGRFLTWNVAFRLVPSCLLFAYFWTTAPLYSSHWKERTPNSKHSSARQGISIHRDTMVLTDVIHPAQGPFPMAYRGVINPVAMNRTQEFIIWYLSYIVPPPGFLIDTIFMFHCIGWGFNIFYRVLRARIETKAEELWLLYWPPPELDELVRLQNLNVDTDLNDQIGTVSKRYSLKTKRTEIRVGKRVVNVLSKNYTSEILDPSFYERCDSIKGFLIGLWSLMRTTLLNRKVMYGMVYASIVVVSLSTQTVESIMSSSLFSFGHENLTAVLDNSATAHIFHDKSMFSNYRVLDPSQSQVATIGEDTCSAHGIGDVEVSWFDDEGTLHKHVLKQALHFPKSGVNLISITAFARENNQEFLSNGGEKVYISTGDGHSKFTWDKYVRNFQHPDSNLPEMPLYPIKQANAFTSNAQLCDDLCQCNHPNAFSYLSDNNNTTTTTNSKSGLTANKRVSWSNVV